LGEFPLCWVVRLGVKRVHRGLTGIQLDPTNRKGILPWLYGQLGVTLLDPNKVDGGKEHLARARATSARPQKQGRFPNTTYSLA